MIYQQYEDTSIVVKRWAPGMFKGKSDLEILEEMLSVPESRRLPMNRAVQEVERTWVLFGRPYFKISPVMVRELSHTSIDIPGEHLELPYDGFAILIPVDMEFDFLKRFPPLRALLERITFALAHSRSAGTSFSRPSV